MADAFGGAHDALNRMRRAHTVDVRPATERIGQPWEMVTSHSILRPPPRFSLHRREECSRQKAYIVAFAHGSPESAITSIFASGFFTLEIYLTLFATGSRMSSQANDASELQRGSQKPDRNWLAVLEPAAAHWRVGRDQSEMHKLQHG